jgi:hypothetical protein
MRLVRCTAAALGASLLACSVGMKQPPAVLLAEDFNQENDVRYRLNYTRFAQWTVAGGTVDLVGTPPFDDFLPASQGMYVDLDGSTHNAGTLGVAHGVRPAARPVPAGRRGARPQGRRRVTGRRGSRLGCPGSRPHTIARP